MRLIDRVAADGRYDAVEFPIEGAGDIQTLRGYAQDPAVRAGSLVSIDYVLDQLIAGGGTGYAASQLARLNRPAVVTALERQLNEATAALRGPLLQLLGWFGDTSQLPQIRRFVDDPDPSIADAAYEAEQRLLGVAKTE